MTAPAPPGQNVINNHIAKRAPSRHDDAGWRRTPLSWSPEAAAWECGAGERRWL
jgi:hypothetical protein